MQNLGWNEENKQLHSSPGFLAWVGNLKPQLGDKSGSPDDGRLPTLQEIPIVLKHLKYSLTVTLALQTGLEKKSIGLYISDCCIARHLYLRLSDFGDKEKQSKLF